MGLRHELFIIDAKLAKALDFSRRKEITRELIDDLLKTLGMEELGPLEIYDAVDDAYPGWSFIQPITTSHISGHYFEEKEGTSHIHMDIYSCKTFEWNSIIEILHNHLNFDTWNANFINRSDDLPLRNIATITGKEKLIESIMPYKN